MKRVYVTGIGVVSSLGLGREALGPALLKGASAASEITLFDASGMGRSIACQVPDFRPRDHLTAAEARRAGRCSAMALAAARMAVEDAGLGSDSLAGSDTAVILGTTMGEANVLGELEAAWIHEGQQAVKPSSLPRYGTTLLPIHIARAFKTRGMVQTLPAACAAGNYAIGYAADQIRAGRVSAAIAGGAEVIEKLQYAGFVRLGAMSPDRCRPFDKNRQGLLVGEGAGILVLESEERVRARGGRILAEVGGYGLACDAHHITRPHPEGAGSAHAMRRCLAASGIKASQVDFVNAHGTATQANDAVESKVINEIFGDHRVKVTSIKSMIGHCMGAASAIEAVSCIMSLCDQVIPPTMHYETKDEACDINVVANEAQQAKIDVVLNNSLAFGGYDAVTCFAREGILPDTVGEG